MKNRTEAQCLSTEVPASNTASITMAFAIPNAAISRPLVFRNVTQQPFIGRPL